MVRSYRMDGALRARVVVVILGGRSLEVTVLQVTNGHCELLSGGGAHPVGGEDWTGAIADHVAAGFHREHGVDLRTDPVARQRVFDACEAAKRRLSTERWAEISVPYAHRRQHVQVSLTREQFDVMTAHLVDDAVERVAAVLGQCGPAPDGVERLAVTGGGSLVPAVPRAVSARIGLPALPGPHPQEAVALGAALSAW